MSSNVQKKKRYLAVFDFDKKSMPGAPGQLLNFKKGDLLYRFDRVDTPQGEWFFGTDSSQNKGWFPSALVTRSRPTRSSGLASPNGLDSLDSSSSFSELSSNALLRPQSPDSGKSSVSPTSSRSSTSPAPNKTTTSSTSAATAATPEVPAVRLLPVLKIVRATHEWTPTAANQLALRAGDVVAVISEEEVGWMEGITFAGSRGKVPTNRVTVIHSGGTSDGQCLGRVVHQSAQQQQKKAAPPTIRTAQSSKRLLDASSAAPPRNRIVREIIQTEEAYVNHLNEVCKSYKEPMEKVPGDWKKTIPVLFQNIDTIRTIAQKLLSELQQVAETWKANTSLLSIPFLEIGPFLVAYEDYCRGFEQAQKTLDGYGSDAAFANFLKATKADLPLEALLVMPVQRIPRYKLLLEDLVRNTQETHPDYANLKDAVLMVSRVATEINEKIRSSERTQTLLEESRDKERLSKYVTKDRTVLISAKDVNVKIDQAKSMVGKVKADAFVLSDSFLLLLRRTVKVDISWLEDFSVVFWPTKLLWTKKGALGSISVAGPLLSITLKIKKGGSEFADCLQAQISKQKVDGGNDNLRVGVYTFGETGIRYDGEWKGGLSGGMMDGKGSILLGLGGMIYTGQFSRNELTGAGKMKIPSGDVLVGTFKDGVLNGEGRIEYANGDTFAGHFNNGVREGKGEFVSSTLTYSGEWAGDNANGNGTLVVGGTRYVGVFEDAVFVSGEYTALDGSVSKGNFVNFSLLDGQGSIRYADGSLFTGIFKVGVREGEGKQEFADGSVLTGVWKHDLPCGNMQWTGGPKQWLKSYVGGFLDGHPHSKVGEATFADGSKFKGSFKDGQMDKGELTMADGAVLIGKFRGNRLQGKASFSPGDSDEQFDGIPDASNRMPAKGKFMSIPMPVSRPSFPVNIAQNSIKK